MELPRMFCSFLPLRRHYKFVTWTQEPLYCDISITTATISNATHPSGHNNMDISKPQENAQRKDAAPVKFPAHRWHSTLLPPAISVACGSRKTKGVLDIIRESAIAAPGNQSTVLVAPFRLNAKPLHSMTNQLTHFERPREFATARQRSK